MSSIFCCDYNKFVSLHCKIHMVSMQYLHSYKMSVNSSRTFGHHSRKLNIRRELEWEQKKMKEKRLYHTFITSHRMMRSGNKRLALVWRDRYLCIGCYYILHKSKWIQKDAGYIYSKSRYCFTACYTTLLPKSIACTIKKIKYAVFIQSMCRARQWQ